MADLGSQPTPIQSLYTWYREDRLYVNRRYQRKLVWTLEEKQKLIESILKQYPIPAILISEKEDKQGAYEIIDGLQRLHAIVSFIETSFSTPGGKVFNLEHFPTAKSYSDQGVFSQSTLTEKLSSKEVSIILDYSLPLSVMRNATEAEVNDVFDRINTYGHRLSDQERRQAGVQNEFSTMVRRIACLLRGDVSSEVLPLYSMPSISIDLPKTKHGYEVQADEVFWVKQGILRSTDLRDSMDEQCIADVAACIVGGILIERSKDALDNLYVQGSYESERILSALEVYGSSKFTDELKYCIEEVEKVCVAEKPEKLRDIVFKKKTTNAFPSVFAALIIAFHELIVRDGNIISDYLGVKKALTDSSERIDRGQKATSAEERRKNIDTVRGLVGAHFIKAARPPQIYGNHTAIDVESIIRRSEIELGAYELKQGLLIVADKGKIDDNIVEKIINTICAVANIGPMSVGKIIIGVTDKDADAKRIMEIDKIEAKKVGKRFVVGINREANRLGVSVEKYFSKLKDNIKKSDLSPALRDSVLSNIDYNSFYGLGVIIMTIPAQSELSYVGEQVFWRNGDTSELVKSPKQIAALAKRF